MRCAPLHQSMICTGLLIGAAPVFADDFYVDAWNGQPSNGGTSPADAWHSITHALATVPDPAPQEVHTIHLAPAIYSAGSGEVFPLVMRPRVQVVGAGGPVGVLIQGSWSGPLVLFQSLASGAGESFDQQSLLARVTLHQGGTGVALVTDWGMLAPRLEDVMVWQALGPGVSIQGGAFGAAGPFAPIFDHVEVWDNTVALSVTMSGEGGESSVKLIDCVLRDGPGHGIELINVSAGGTLTLDALRTTVKNRSEDALHVRYTNGAHVSTKLLYCALLKTAGDGIEVEADAGLGGVATTRLDHCTVTQHTGRGLAISTAGGASVAHPTELDSTILWGNGDDLLEDSGAPSITSIARCNIGDGDYLGVNGNISTNPRFVDPSFDDYRLRYGSPCIDRGNALPRALAGTNSLGGIVAPVDGDLDLLAGWDIGASEFAPLQLRGTARLGSVVTLQAFGKSGLAARVLWRRGPPSSTPRRLPYGDWWLGSGALEWGLLPTNPGTPGEIRFAIPNDATLLGRSYSFQALVRPSEGVPYPGVLTNVVSFTVLP